MPFLGSNMIDEAELHNDIGFIKKITLTGVFFLLAPIVLAASMITLLLFNSEKLEEPKEVAVEQINPKGASIFASLPASSPEISTSIKAGDARPYIIKNYLEKYNSPLIGYEEFIVEMADKYSLDFRLITAIAQQESNLCKRIPEGSYNCWGWGIHSRGSLGFTSYEDGIRTVSRGLRDEYLEKGYTTVEDIMLKYTPLSPGTWASGVTAFMQEMQ